MPLASLEDAGKAFVKQPVLPMRLSPQMAGARVRRPMLRTMRIQILANALLVSPTSTGTASR